MRSNSDFCFVLSVVHGIVAETGESSLSNLAYLGVKV